MGTNVPQKLVFLPKIKGTIGAWYATFSNGMAITYRPAGAASSRTPTTMATVEIKSNSIELLNNNKNLKLKFPKD
ncbi:hypothetical protein RAA17_05625 [Komagataeibacter rhaeticus]|nr:hypothetical protein [Komagataeibacter rhaeticus]